MKTLLLALMPLLLFSGCVYQVPGTAAYVTRTNYKYVKPDNYSYDINKERITQSYGGKYKKKPRYKVYPQYNNILEIKTKKIVQPTLYPQYRKKQEAKQAASRKYQDNTDHAEPDVHSKHEKKQYNEHRDNSMSKVYLRNVETKKRSEILKREQKRSSYKRALLVNRDG